MKPVVSVIRASFGACALVAALAFCDDPTGPGVNPTAPKVRDRPLVAASAGPATIVAAGDIARCGTFVNDDSTAKLVRAVPDAAVLTLGDNVNPTNATSGVTGADYVNCYGPNWGQPDILSRTYPSPGELDWTATNGGAEYLGYFGGNTSVDPGGPDGAGYYSYDVGDWHIIALNSHVPMDALSAQVRWLKNDLTLNTKECTLAYWHLPRFASFGTTPVRSSVKPLWDALFAAGVDVVLNGHLRGYERFKPQRPDSTYDPQYGIRQFLVGTGGIMESATVSARLANSEAVIERVNGVLVMTLDAGRYSWEFRPRGGKTLPAPESGSAMCHGSPLPTAKTGGPYQSEGAVLFDGRMSTDPQRDAIVAYEWDFGDGSTGTGATVSHTYANDGDYTATLTVTDANGDRSEPATTAVTIQNFAPVVDAGVDQWAHAGTAVEVRAHVTDLGTNDAPWSYTITWGDGATSQGTTPTLDNPLAASHAYSADGEYIATVAVTDKDGGLGTDRLTVTVSSTSAPAQVFVGAGDIGTCTSTDDDATAKLLDGIPGTVFTVGDNVYPDGKAEEYRRCFEPAWGRHKGRTFAAIGNHEYNTPDATPTFDYFGPRVGPRGKAYYSYNLGAWHIIVLNSNDAFVPYAAGSAQHQWLKDDLALNNSRCTIAIWHHPRFYSTSTGEKGQSNKQKVLWDELYAAGVELVLVGHNHHYERFRKQTPTGEPDDQYGIRQFIIGTGGDGGGKPVKSWENTEALSGAIGVLKFTLEPDKYSWEFVPIPGETFSDAGSAACHDPRSAEPQNTAPVANPDQYAIDEDNTLTVSTTVSAPGSQSVLGNDIDADGDLLMASLVAGEGPANGALDLNTDGTFTYTPNLDFHGTDAFMYQVSDGKGGTATATVTIGVTPVNDAPVAADDGVYSVAENQILTTSAAAGVLANDSDVDDADLTAQLVTEPSSGELTLNADGSFTYTPSANFSGTDSFEYRVSDGSLESDAATVTIAVTDVNNSPVAVNDPIYSVAEDQTLTTTVATGVLANDTDSDGDPLEATVVQGPATSATGSFTLDPNGAFTFAPTADFSGVVTFTYKASDASGMASNVATVTISVTPVNDVPAAEAQSISTTEDTPVSIVLAGRDVDGDALTFSIATPPAHGSLSAASPGTYTYTPHENFAGSDEFAFTASDAKSQSAPATVTIAIGETNDAPIAANDGYEVEEDNVRSVAAPGILANDTDVESGDALAAVLVSGPTHGTLTLEASGAFTYTPAANFEGTDAFTYEASDGTARSNRGTVTIAVRAVNDAPVAQPQAVTTDEDRAVTITLAGEDVESGQVTYRITAPPSHGTLSGEGTVYTYTPNANYLGADAFSFVVNDGTGDSPPAAVSITVIAVNDVPTAIADQYSLDEDNILTGRGAQGLLANDTDVDGDALSASVGAGQGPSSGTLDLNADGTFTYAPNADFHGTDGFTYQASDGNGGTSSTTVTITVHPVNDAPTFVKGDDQTVSEDAGPQTVSGWATRIAAGANEEGQTVEFNVTNNNPVLFSVQPDVDPITGNLVYTPATNASGSATITVALHDDGGIANGGVDTSAPQTFAIVVNPVNDGPIASGESYVTEEDVTLSRAAPGLLANDSDPDGDPLTATIIVPPAHGRLSLNGDGSFAYTPAANFNGADTFTYTVNDGGLESASATVTITVTPVNDRPVATADSYTVSEDRQLAIAIPGVLANDIDPDVDQTLRAVLGSGPSNGTLIFNEDGSLTYTPNLHFSGLDAFTYRSHDGLENSEAATVTITVTPRMMVTLDIIPGSSTNSIGYSSSQTQIVFAIVSSATFDATLVEPASVRLGDEKGADTPLARNADGSFKFLLVDINGDGRRDFYAYVNKAELKANGDLTLTTTSMTVLGGLIAPRPELFRGRDKVNVVP